MVTVTTRSLALAGAAALAAGIVAVAGPAAAHTDFIGADPHDGANLHALPGEVRLEFSDTMAPGLSTVTLQDGDGRSTTLDVANGGKATVLVATVPDMLAPEDGTTTRWTVTFRVVSRDGHPVVGSTTFAVRTPETPTSSPSASSSSSLGTVSPEPEPGASATAEPDVPANDEQGVPEGTDAWPLGVGLGVLALLVLAVAAVMRLVAARDSDT